MVIRPQAGPQESFLSTPADIAIYGGAAGGGKTWALLLEPLRHISNKEFGAVIFRRTTPQIRNEGGLWDESSSLYPHVGGDPKEHTLEWKFKSGATVSFSHLEHEKNVHDWQGSQIPLICFDELTHFTARQFWYMLSRNRSMCGVRPYVRATCNPDPDSFVADLIKWWIDQDTGYAIPERSGVIRYFVRINNELHWADKPDELRESYPDAGEPKSMTFIAASIEDNRALLDADPGYMANLNALPLVERERLKRGNWKIRDETASIYKPKWWQKWPADKPLPHCLHVFASYDTAFSTKDRKESAYSARTTWGVFEDEASGRHALILLEAWHDKASYPELRKAAIEHKRKFNPDSLLIEKKASGHSLLQDMRRLRIPVRGFNPNKHGDKEERAHKATPLFHSGLVYYPDKKWAKDVIAYVAGFPDGEPPSADYADTVSQACIFVKERMWMQPPDEDAPDVETEELSEEWLEDNEEEPRAAYG